MLIIRKPFPTKEAILFGSLSLLVGYFGVISLMLELSPANVAGSEQNVARKRDTSHDSVQAPKQPEVTQEADSQSGSDNGTVSTSIPSTPQAVIPADPPVVQQAVEVVSQPTIPVTPEVTPAAPTETIPPAVPVPAVPPVPSVEVNTPVLNVTVDETLPL